MKEEGKDRAVGIDLLSLLPFVQQMLVVVFIRPWFDENLLTDY